MNPFEDVLYYQAKAEIAIEDGDIETAKVYAQLADSSSRSTGARPPVLRQMQQVDREMLKERIKKGDKQPFAPPTPPTPAPPVDPGNPNPGKKVQEGGVSRREIAAKLLGEPDA